MKAGVATTRPMHSVAWFCSQAHLNCKHRYSSIRLWSCN